MRKHAKKIVAVFLAVCVSMLGGLSWLLTAGDSLAANDSLTIKAGFYGGPYYTLHQYTDSEMSALSDGNVWTYSGVDSGNFMRVGYAWGVPLDRLINDAGVDLDSVKFLHMGTSDSYGESYTTFSASTLLSERYFFPMFINAASDPNARWPVIDYSKVDSGISGEAYTVPTLLAIGSTEFSRDEAGQVLSMQDYKKLDKSELSSAHKYRLFYGQSGLSSGAAYNVQTSDKWVYEINLQLAGSPDISVEKTLVSGKEGEKGSRYEVSINVALPESYSYLSSDIRASLIQQILQSVQVGYDSSKLKMSDKGNGKYDMEIIGSGDSEITASYTRTEYDGTETTAQGSIIVKASDKGQGGGSGGKDDGKGDAGNSGSDSRDDGKTGGKGLNADGKNYKNEENKSADKKGDNAETSDPGDAADDTSDGNDGTWAEAKLSESPEQNAGKFGWGVGIGLGVLFLSGFAGTIISFYRNV